MKKINNIINYLDELYPNPQCELIFNNPYELFVALLLSPQTTDKRVNEVTSFLFKKYPTFLSIKEANMEALEKAIKPIGMYKRKAFYLKEVATIMIDKYNGQIPSKREELEKLPGVGRKIANLLLTMLYNQPYFAVDTHVIRVTKRLGLAKKGDSPLIIEKKLYTYFPNNIVAKAHYQLVLFGRYHCKAQKPNCYNCKLKLICKYKNKKEDA